MMETKVMHVPDGAHGPLIERPSKRQGWPFRKTIIALVIFNMVTWLATAYVWMVMV